MNTETDSSGTDQNTTAQPKKWWQWFLIYPVLVTSLIAAIPTYVEAFKSTEYGVKFGQSSNAKEQDNLWKINLSCTAAPLDPLVTIHNIKVDATICKSGDVFVRIFSPTGEPFYKWVAVNAVINEKVTVGLGGIISGAYASTNQDPKPMLVALNSTVICQKYLGPGKVLRRVSISGRGCFDEIINTYTGAVQSRIPTACNPQC